MEEVARGFGTGEPRRGSERVDLVHLWGGDEVGISNRKQPKRYTFFLEPKARVVGAMYVQ